MNEIWTKLNAWLHRKESEKFTTDGDGNTAINIIGTVTQEGLNEGGQITSVPLTDSDWTLLERSATTTPIGSGAYANRKSFTLQNQTKKDIIIQYDNTSGVAVNILIRGGSERFYNGETPIKLYGRMVSGTGEIMLEETA